MLAATLPEVHCVLQTFLPALDGMQMITFGTGWHAGLQLMQTDGMKSWLADANVLDLTKAGHAVGTLAA